MLRAHFACGAKSALEIRTDLREARDCQITRSSASADMQTRRFGGFCYFGVSLSKYLDAIDARSVRAQGEAASRCCARKGKRLNNLGFAAMRAFQRRRLCVGITNRQTCASQ